VALRPVTPTLCAAITVVNAGAAVSFRVPELCLMGASLLLVACPSPCADEDLGDPVAYDDGINDGTTYLSSPLEGPYLHLPPGRKYHLIHGLGKAPAVVTAYLAFDESGSVSQSAGKQAILSWNESVISVANETCAEFYVLVTASSSPDGVSLDAGTDSGAPDGG
jgi:hypothetical protein